VQVFPCQAASFPIRYLGMPLSVSKLPKSALQPLLDDMADRLPVWRGKLMHMSGRLTLIKMMLAVIPIYTVISFHLPLVPEGDVQDFHGFPLDGHRGHARREMPGGWKRVHHPIHLGGLRVMDFNLLGRALRQRWLLLSRMNGARPWALHPVSDDTATESFFQASTSCVIRDGQSTRFWTDPWLDGRCIGALMPELLAMISARARRQRTVASALAGHAWIRDITGVLTIPVLMQYLILRQQLDDITLSSGIMGRMVWKWTASDQYSSNSAYAAMFRRRRVHHHLHLRHATPKLKRTVTTALLCRRGLREPGDVAAREPRLPVPPIGAPVLDVVHGAGVHAGHRGGHAVRVGPRRVEGGDAAGLAEGVFGRVRAEGVGGDELAGAGVEPELGRGHDEVGVPAHGAARAVTDPGQHARRGLHLPPHAPAVAPAAVH
jgi:hypothetical protein